MIKETCSCGATFEIAEKWASDENLAAREWREKHHHEVKSAYIPPPEERLPRQGSNTYVLNEDYVYNEDGDPVWVSNIRNPPLFWWQHVPHEHAS